MRKTRYHDDLTNKGDTVWYSLMECHLLNIIHLYTMFMSISFLFIKGKVGKEFEKIIT